MTAAEDLVSATTTCFLGQDPWVAFDCLHRVGIRDVEVPALPARQSIEWRQTIFAPELLGAASCIEMARQAGMVVAMGHTDATYEQARAGMARGARHAVHMYNAMRPFSHRDSGVIGFRRDCSVLHDDRKLLLKICRRQFVRNFRTASLCEQREPNR